MWIFRRMGNGQVKILERKDLRCRRGSISWNFRYNGAVKKKDEPTMMVFNSQMNISEWLYLLNLEQYRAHFRNYLHVEEVADLSEDDFKRLGVSDCQHRSKMLSSLIGIQVRRRQSMSVEGRTVSSKFVRRKNSCPPMYIASILGDNDRKRSPSFNDDQNECSSMHQNHGQDNLMHQKSALTKVRRKNSCPPMYIASILGDNDRKRSPSFNDDQNECSSMHQNHGQDNLIYETLNIVKPTININNNTSINMDDSEALSQASVSNEAQEAIALKKALEWELSLDSRDLRSHAWYHGPLPRQRAEEIVQREGDFLIRDCASQPDNYVLTCKTKSSILHFVINKILLQPETVYERIQFQFEEDAFDAVPDLITFYVGSGKPISAASGARIQYPCNRTYPLSFYGHKIVGNQLHTQMLAGIRGGSPLTSPSPNSPTFRFNPYNQQNNSYRSPMSSPPRTKRDVPPRLPSKKQRSQSLIPSQSVTALNIRSVETCSSADGIIQANDNCSQKPTESNKKIKNVEKNNDRQSVSNHCNGFQTIARSTISESIEHMKFTTHSLPRPNVGGLRFSSMRGCATNRDTPEASLSPCIETKTFPETTDNAPSPPPKPIRAPGLPKKEKDMIPQDQHAVHRVASYHASGSDSGNGSGDSVQSSTPGDSADFTHHRGVIIKNPRYLLHSASSITLKSLTEFDIAEAEEEVSKMECPVPKWISKFDIDNFSTLLLPSIENKPLDGDALSTFKMMLLETGPKTLAEHLTRIDINLIIEEATRNEDDPSSVLQRCGLELLTLPDGRIFRNDLLERTQCLKLMVAVTILTCQTDHDRAEILSKWIQIAVDTKTALGNLFGFSAIMLGLCMPQIQRLDNAWHILRQNFTDSAFTFEAKLRPTLKNMNDCSNPQAPNTTVPHVLLYILLKDRIIDNLFDIQVEEKSSLLTTCIAPWETKADDFGMSINFLHLDSARGFLKNLNLFRKNAKIIMEESNSRLDELLSDAFRTEFHVKFLWGSKGALATPDDRHSKLEKVLALMAEKFCNADNVTSPS